MRGILAIATLLLGVAIILAGNGLLGSLLGVSGQLAGFSPATLGLIMGGYFAGFVIGTFLVPDLVRRVGHIRIFAALASIASVTALLHGLLMVPFIWLVLRVISGICVVGLYIAIESWLHEQTTNAERGNIFSAYMTTTLVGLGLGQFLLAIGDITTLQLFAIASVLLSLGLVPVALTRVREPAIAAAQRLGLRRLYEISPLGVVGCIFAGLGSGAFWGMGPVFASSIGLGTAGVAGFMGLTILGGVAMMWPVGRLSDRFERRQVLMWVCIATALAGAAAMWLNQIDPRWVLLGGFGYGAVSFSIYSLAAAHTNDHVDGSQMLEVTSSLQLLWGSGAIVGPIAAGIIMQFAQPEALLPFMAIAALIPGIFARYRMLVSDSIPMDAQSDYVVQFATSPSALEMYPESDEDEPS